MLPFRFYLITDRLHTRGDPTALLPALAGAGLRALQVREKDLAPRALFAWCRGLQAGLGEGGAGLQLYLNDRADLALSLGFAGVHLREESLPLADHAAALRHGLRFGISTHSLEGVLEAEAAGADFVVFGPVFATGSKAAYGEPLGMEALKEAAARTALPVLALGGVTPERARACREAGAHGAAAISAVWDAPDPLKALAAFGEALGGL